MSRVRIHNFSISLDGFGTGEGQSLDAPFGHAGMRLHEWAFATRTFRAMGHGEGGSHGVDEAFASRWAEGIGVEIMGAHKFGPVADATWQGWWGDEPPFHTPVIVLTHHARAPLTLGETTFHFVDLSAVEALAQARALAPGADVRIGGGVDTLRQFLAADLVDHAHLVVTPIVLGRGERLWDGLEGLEGRFAIESTASPSGVVHLVLTRRREDSRPT